LRAATGSRFGEADRMRRPKGDLDVVAGSWTIEREEDGYVQHHTAVPGSRTDQLALRVWPGVRPGGPPKAEPGALTPGRGAAGAALI
jgi:hypothetical protein